MKIYKINGKCNVSGEIVRLEREKAKLLGLDGITTSKILSIYFFCKMC